MHLNLNLSLKLFKNHIQVTQYFIPPSEMVMKCYDGIDTTFIIPYKIIPNKFRKCRLYHYLSHKI